MASSQYIHLEVPSSMDAESVRKALCILRSDIHTEMYQQFDCRYAPDSLANVGFVAEDCDLAAQLVSSTIEDLFGAETALA